MDGALKFLEVDGTRIEKLLAFARKEHDQLVRMCWFAGTELAIELLV
jgi:hypothetical protein